MAPFLFAGLQASAHPSLHFASFPGDDASAEANRLRRLLSRDQFVPVSFAEANLSKSFRESIELKRLQSIANGVGLHGHLVSVCKHIAMLLTAGTQRNALNPSELRLFLYGGKGFRARKSERNSFL